MSLQKSIDSGKEHRKNYQSGTCASAYVGKGKCSYCSSGKYRKQKAINKLHNEEMRIK